MTPRALRREGRAAPRITVSTFRRGVTAFVGSFVAEGDHAVNARGAAGVAGTR